MEWIKKLGRGFLAIGTANAKLVGIVAGLATTVGFIWHYGPWLAGLLSPYEVEVRVNAAPLLVGAAALLIALLCWRRRRSADLRLAHRPEYKGYTWVIRVWRRDPTSSRDLDVEGALCPECADGAIMHGIDSWGEQGYLCLHHPGSRVTLGQNERELFLKGIYDRLRSREIPLKFE